MVEFFCEDRGEGLAFLLAYAFFITGGFFLAYQYQKKEISKLQAEVNIARGKRIY